MYEKIMSQLTPAFRLMTGVVLFLVGIIWQLASGKTLDMYAFYILAAAMLCFCNVIMCKISKSEADIILYMVLNMAVLIVGFALTESENISGVVMYSIWVLCVVADWIVNAVLFSCESILKRIAVGFVTMLFNVVLIAIVFIVPILWSAHK